MTPLHLRSVATILSAMAMTALLFAVSPTLAAAQCNLNGANCGADATRTSSLTVYHTYTDGGSNVHPVEPDTGETWSVTASYQLQTNSTACDCSIRQPSVSVDVDWNGSAWVAACTGCSGAGPIYSVDVCTVDGCGDESIDHSWAYELIVDLDNNANFTCGLVAQPGALRQVDYLATSVDDGDTINEGDCTEDIAVTPTTTSAFGASDTGAFECSFTCAGASGPSVTITYELP